jgi:hypothetical protein
VPEHSSLIIKLLKEANQKTHGRSVVFKDLVDHCVKKVTTSDIDKIKVSTYSEMDKVLMQLEKYNLKHSIDLSLGEYLVKQLKI